MTLAPFRWGTSATPGALHDLAQLRAVAALMGFRTFSGRPLMPWQEHVCRVASERHPDDPRQLRYPIVVMSEPRQTGKTVVSTVVRADRSIRYPGHLAYSTAQTGLSARKLWTKGTLAMFDAITADQLNTPTNPLLLAQVRKIDRSAGSPGVRLVNGSLMAPFAPGPKCLDGETKVNLLEVDEAFAFDDVAGAQLMGSIGATQSVATPKQLWIYSTKGGRRSTWLADWLAKGRAAVADPDATMAYFEHSADPDCDPEDPQSLLFHPAIGHTTTLDNLWADRPKYSLAEWRRGYLNLDADEATTYALDPVAFANLARDEARQLPDDLSRVAIAVDLAVDSSGATIAAAWQAGPGLIAVAIIASKAGVDWVPAILADLARRGPRTILADPTGPTRSLVADLAALEPEPVYLTMTSTQDYSSACQWTLDAAKGVAVTKLCHDGDPNMCEQVKDLATKILGRAEAFDVYKSTGPIDSLRALALAAHHAATNPMIDQVF